VHGESIVMRILDKKDYASVTRIGFSLMTNNVRTLDWFA